MQQSNTPGLVLVRFADGAYASGRKVCAVPDNVYLSRGTTVLVKFCDSEHTAVCMTDTVYPDDDTYDLICKAFVVPDFPVISARMTIQRFDDKKGG